MEKTYNFSGTCSRNVTFDIDENHVVTNIRFNGGCNGNRKGVAALCEGMKAEEIIKRIEGLKCGMKQTSCPDQFAKSLQKELAAK